MTNIALNHFIDDLNQWFDAAHCRPDAANTPTSQWKPAVDIACHDNEFVIYADLPGVRKEQLEITTDKNVLTIKGERSAPQFESDGSRLERKFGEFERAFNLPETADDENIAAKFTDGVLLITIPKKAQNLARTITVES